MGIFDKFKLGLNKSSKSLSSGLNDLIFKKKIDENMLDELEDFLIQSDVGIESAKELRSKFRPDDLDRVNQLLMIANNENLESETIKQARILEGSLRNTGIHACGVIITPDDITNFVPIATAKDSDLNVTQFDNAVVEQAGLLKMDFLGLKTLTLIKNTVKIVKAKYGVVLDPDNFPLDDKKTFELFQNGETVGIFQYESPGMQKHLKNLKKVGSIKKKKKIQIMKN